MKTIILYRDDIDNDRKPYLWERLCESLGLVHFDDYFPEYPDKITITVAKAEAEGE